MTQLTDEHFIDTKNKQFERQKIKFLKELRL